MASDVVAPRPEALARALLSVFKLRIGLAIMLCALAGIAVTPGPGLSAWQVAILALAVLLSSASAGGFNQYVERDLDARMRRTRLRPFVTGRFRPGPLWPAAIGLLLALSVLAAALATNWVAAVHVFLGAFVYGVVYTVWLKRRSWTNIVIGGLAGSFAVLAGAAAVDPGLAPAPLILALVLFLWTPPHFWSLATALHKDYAAAGVPMLPVVIGDRPAAWVILAHAVALCALALVPFWLGLGWIYLVAASIGGGWFIGRSIQLVQKPCPARAMRNFRASLAQLSLLLLGAIADPLLASHGAAAGAVLDEAEALRVGQAAIGRELGEHTLWDKDGRRLRLAELRGRPVVLNLVYTSCSGLCPTVVQTLDAAVAAAQDALGADRFAVLTIGFDTQNDTPERMRAFARAQGIGRPGWRFLSGDAGTVAALADEVGFVVYPAPQGFDHMALTTIVDPEGRVYRQIYGSTFEPPAVVEPLKELVFGRRSAWNSVDGLVNRIRLFCTLYDPRTGSYRFDYAPFIGMAIGLAALAGVAGFLIREWRRTGRPQPGA